MPALPTNCGLMTDPRSLEYVLLGGLRAAALEIGAPRRSRCRVAGGRDPGATGRSRRRSRRRCRGCRPHGCCANLAGTSTSLPKSRSISTLADLRAPMRPTMGFPPRSSCSMSDPRPPHLLPSGSFSSSVDAVLMNPPFNDPARHRVVRQTRSRGIAHVATETTAGELGLRGAAHSQAQGNADALIWRADGIAEVLARARSRFREPRDFAGSRRSPKGPANRILVRATKSGRAPTQIHAAPDAQ